MITKDKIFTFVTFVVLFFTIAELLFNNKSSEEKLRESFKNLPATIIITDSTGKKDTINLKDYIKKDSANK
jgi:hypothetical protein